MAPESAPRELWARGAEAPTELPVDDLWSDVVRIHAMGEQPAQALCIRHCGEVVLDRVTVLMVEDEIE